MKKYLASVVIVLGLLSAGKVSAQNKIGYIDVNEAISIMPEMGKIDTLLQHFQTDSLNATFAELLQNYNYKDSMLNKTDTSKMPQSVKNQYRQDRENLVYQIQNWQNISQQVYQNKQAQLIQPVYKKVNDAIRVVAKENGYGYVLVKDALVIMPPADDLLPLVAKKLGVKLPPQLQTGK
ncbi:MAG TPA: OmpH family outer membrane protein [Chitinophagaceae bacterium]|nr:OmpH family outer membrane protein [Chitinophagaceae bacterium]